IPYFSNDKGLPTNAVYGFTQMLLKLIKEHDPDHLAVAFDAKGPTFRHKLFSDYKATRPSMPEELRPQIPYIREVVAAYRVAALEVEGYEADDVIGTIARRCGERGIDVVMVTGDKDMMQLVDKNTSMLDTMKEKRYGVDEVVEKFGVKPHRVVEVMALMGDSSDNIPGVPGIGPKGARKLIQEFGTIDHLYEEIAKVTGKAMKEKLISNEKLARLSRELVVIDVNAPVECAFEDLVTTEPDMEQLRKLFTELGFNRLLRDLSNLSQEGQPKGERLNHPPQLITDRESLDRLIGELSQADAFALSIHHTSRESSGEEAATIAIAPIKDLSEVSHNNAPCSLLSSLQEEGEGGFKTPAPLQALKPLLEDPGVGKVSANGKRLALDLMERGITLRGLTMDTSVASYLLNPSSSDHSLRSVAMKQLGEEVGEVEYKNSAAAVEEHLVPLLCAEAEALRRLAPLLTEELEKAGLITLFREIELPLIPVLAQMERHGITVDRSQLTNLSHELEAMLQEREEAIFSMAGVEFNINSPKQLAEILFEKLELKPVRKTKTGFSTDEKVLTILAATHDLPKVILEYRHLAKLKSTYVDAIIGLIEPSTGRVHSSFNQTVTATGRLSSSKPNLQNIPIKTEIGGRIREAFIADEGYILLSADYSQIELRLVAHLSGDEILIESFKKGEDIHRRTASEVFGIMPGLVTEEMRRRAKAINFGIIYGMGPHGLAGELGVSQKVAKEYIESYFDRYSGVRCFINETIRDAAEKKYTTSLFGRKRYIPELASRVDSVRKFGERIAINTPIQGTAADIIKIAMIRIATRMESEAKESRMLLQIHDELLFEVPHDEMESMKTLVVSEMEGVVKLEIPIVVNISAGESWRKSE
ncbi:MAG: DNA polymerase I, partial [Deltaproteobacteria bacterium]|nr:DNA polymerase I [Deltaproteobacteria bacterium]